MSAEAVPLPARGGPVGLAREALTAVRALLGGADATFAPQWAFEERASVIADLDRVVELAMLYRSRVVAAHREDGRWARSGDRSFENHRARTGRIGIGAARAETDLGQGLAQMPRAATAVEDGTVGLAHAQVLTRARARASAAVREALDAGGAAELLVLAEGLDVATFTRRVDAWVAAHDVAAAERSFEAVRARRFLRLVERDGGTRLDGFVDPVVGATFRTCLEAVTPVPGADDERTSEQRAADALALIAGRVLDAGADKIGAQIRPHVSLIVPASTWSATRARRANRGGTAAGSGGTSGTGEITVGAGEGGAALVLPELDDGTVIPLSELERIACDCELTRIVMDADGIPLDVGQTERTYAKSLRRAVLVRDGHCRWPGCTLRASWCEVHHVAWYSRGGTTSIDNALTLCVHHHHEIHRKNIDISPTGRGHAFTRADGTVIGTTTREDGIVRMLTPRREAGGGEPPGRVDSREPRALEGPAGDAPPTAADKDSGAAHRQHERATQPARTPDRARTVESEAARRRAWPPTRHDQAPPETGPLF